MNNRMTREELAMILGVDVVTDEMLYKEIREVGEIQSRIQIGEVKITSERLFRKLKQINSIESSEYYDVFQKLLFSNDIVNGEYRDSGCIFMEDSLGSCFYNSDKVRSRIHELEVENEYLEFKIEEDGEDAEDPACCCPAIDSLEFNNEYKDELWRIWHLMEIATNINAPLELGTYLEELMCLYKENKNW